MFKLLEAQYSYLIFQQDFSTSKTNVKDRVTMV